MRPSIEVMYLVVYFIYRTRICVLGTVLGSDGLIWVHHHTSPDPNKIKLFIRKDERSRPEARSPESPKEGEGVRVLV